MFLFACLILSLDSCRDDRAKCRKSEAEKDSKSYQQGRRLPGVRSSDVSSPYRYFALCFSVCGHLHICIYV